MSQSKRNNSRINRDNDLCVSIRQRRLRKELAKKRANQERDSKLKRRSCEG